MAGQATVGHDAAGKEAGMLIEGRLMLDPAERPVPGWLEVEHGRIVAIEEGAPPGKADMGDADSVICPAFIDAHTHLPQFRSVGCDGMDLLTWLERVIYPAEHGWRDAEIIRHEIRMASQAMLRHGTMGYAGYLTSHPHALETFTSMSDLPPLRAIVGLSLMDREAPTHLLHGFEDIRAARTPRYGSDRMSISLNPRYAVACSDALLASAGRASQQGQYVQTHLAESVREVQRVAELFPDDPHYTGVYDRHGLLHERTLLAHCLHLSRDEWALLADRHCVIVHCPTANLFLSSGLFDLPAADEHGVRVALGSDIAAGCDVSMPRIARAMIEVAKARAMSCTPSQRIPTPDEAFTMITRGNADALGWPDSGRIEIGAAADLLILRLPFELDAYYVSRLLYGWDPAFIDTRILAGCIIDLLAPTD
jgi:guanine deaminase